jgi:hypothetical protein
MHRVPRRSPSDRRRRDDSARCRDQAHDPLADPKAGVPDGHRVQPNGRNQLKYIARPERINRADLARQPGCDQGWKGRQRYLAPGHYVAQADQEPARSDHAFSAERPRIESQSAAPAMPFHGSADVASHPQEYAIDSVRSRPRPQPHIAPRTPATGEELGAPRVQTSCL